MPDPIEYILSSFNLDVKTTVYPYGTGLINHTWLITDKGQDYILQKINQDVFRNPRDIADNIQAIAAFLAENHPTYLFIAPLNTKDGKNLLHICNDGYYRLFPFVKDSHSFDIVKKPQQASEAAKQFGLFTRMLNNFPTENLKITLPHFHDLEWRYLQFEQALQYGNPSRIKETKDIIDFLRSNDHIVYTYKEIVKNKAFKLRVTHHDTKISNVLFDKNQKGLCVIDLDTVMPGYFISDIGDMMRTYLSPVSEEEKDLEKIVVREDYFYAIVEGYLSEMRHELTETELRHFVYAGMFMIYMQSLRFLTDYLEDDRYYGTLYEGHNYVRAGNQATLLQQLLNKRKILEKAVLSVKF